MTNPQNDLRNGRPGADANTNASNVMEKVIPIPVIIEPAKVDNISRAPSAPTPKSRGH